MKNLCTLLVACSLLFLFSNCAQLSSFQTAKTVGKDNGEIGFAGGGVGFTELIDNTDETTPVLPIIELWGRYGVGENVDLGLKLSTGLSAVVDAKWQFLGDRDADFAMALGGGIGFQGGTLESALLQGHVPLHMSYHPSEKFALYLTPRYISQFIVGEGSINYGGTSFGFESGQKIKFVMDISYFKVLNDVNDVDDVFNDLGIGLFQFGLGMKFHLGNY